MRILTIGADLSLKVHGMLVVKAACSVLDAVDTLADAAEAIPGVPYAAILLSASLPDGPSIAWLGQQRRQGLAAPVLFVTYRDHTEERIAAFEAGADDCIRLPVTEREMVARLRAVLRRPPLVTQDALIAGNTRLDPITREVWVGQTRIWVPRREVSLLEQLMRRFNRVAPRAQLEANIYGLSDEVAPNSIEVGVSRIRRRLADADASVGIRTVRGIGYCLHLLSEQAMLHGETGTQTA